LGIKNDAGRCEKNNSIDKKNFRYCVNEDFTKIPDNLSQPNNDGKTNTLLGIIVQAFILSSQKK